MANPLWMYKVTLQGSTPKNKTSLNFVLEYDDAASPMDHAAALNAANQIRGGLVAITDAFLARESLDYLISADNQLPAGNIDVMDEAAVIVYLNDPTGNLPKYHTVRIPAPDSTVFLADGETVDIGDAALIQYIQQLSQHAFVSDNEQINTTSQNGIASGHKRSRAKSYR